MDKFKKITDKVDSLLGKMCAKIENNIQSQEGEISNSINKVLDSAQMVEEGGKITHEKDITDIKETKLISETDNILKVSLKKDGEK